MKYFSYLFGFTLPFIAVGALNWYINPFLFFPHTIFAFPGGMKNPMERMEIAYKYERLQPPNAILGTSRVKNIPAYPSSYWLPGEVLNMSIASASMFELEQYFEHVATSGKTKKILIGLDYDFFNWSPAPGFDSNRLHHYENDSLPRLAKAKIADTYRSLFSEQATRLSLSFLVGARPSSLNGTITYTPEGLLPIYAFANFKKNAPTGTSEFNDPLISFKRILEIATKERISVTFIIPPVYAPYMEGKIGKKWDDFEKWKRYIVTMANAEEEKSKMSYPIWDFSGFNSVTKDVDGKIPSWYYDPSHFKSIIGMKILEKVYGNCKKNCTAPEDFGVQLDVTTIETHLKRLRSERNQYIKTMPVKK